MANHPDLEPLYFSLAEVTEETHVSENRLLHLASRGELELCAFFDPSWEMVWCDEGEQHPSPTFQRPLESSSGLVAIVSVTRPRPDLSVVPMWFKRSTADLATGEAVHLRLARLPAGTPAYIPKEES